MMPDTANKFLISEDFGQEFALGRAV